MSLWDPAPAPVLLVAQVAAGLLSHPHCGGRPEPARRVSLGLAVPCSREVLWRRPRSLITGWVVVLCSLMAGVMGGTT